MVFADFFTEVIGYGFLMLVLILIWIGWIAQKIGSAAGKVLKDKDFQEGVKLGFWAWFLSDD